MKTYKVTRECSQTRQHTWSEGIFIEAKCLEQAKAFAKEHGTTWTEDKGSHREEDHYRWPDVQYDDDELEVEEYSEPALPPGIQVQNAANFKDETEDFADTDPTDQSWTVEVSFENNGRSIQDHLAGFAHKHEAEEHARSMERLGFRADLQGRT